MPVADFATCAKPVFPQPEYILERSYGAGRGVALGGIKQAQQILAGMYEPGEGVAADHAKAATWRAIADAPPAQVR